MTTTKQSTAEGVFYKTVTPEGRDFYTKTLDYEAALKTGKPVHHPTSTRIDPTDRSTFLAISATPTAAMGSLSYPSRLLKVTPLDNPVPLKSFPQWYATLALKVLEERPLRELFGRHGRRLLEFYEDVSLLSTEQLSDLANHPRTDSKTVDELTYKYCRDVSLAFSAGRAHDLLASPRGRLLPKSQELGGFSSAAGQAAGHAAAAIVLRDFLPDEAWEELTAPWRAVCGDLIFTKPILSPPPTPE